MIFVTGDTHGEQGRMLWLLRQEPLRSGDTLIVCGDFGYLFSGSEAEADFLDHLEQHPATICFVDGNHENFPLISAFPEEVWNGGRIHRIRKNVIHLMRGQVFTLEGRRFFTMGGAYSIDKYRREPGRSWWPEEIPTAEEFAEARRNLDDCGWQVDYVLSHTAPTKIVYFLGMRLRFSPDQHDLALTEFLTEVWERLRFTRWYFGHFHEDMDPLPVYDEFSLLFQKVCRLP